MEHSQILGVVVYELNSKNFVVQVCWYTGIIDLTKKGILLSSEWDVIVDTHMLGMATIGTAPHSTTPVVLLEFGIVLSL